MRTSSLFNAVRRYFRRSNAWLTNTPDRALQEAYEAAQMIRELENRHFNGEPISPESGIYGRSAQDYFQAELKKYLDIIKVRMAEFRTSSSIVRFGDRVTAEIERTDLELPPSEGDRPPEEIRDRRTVVSEKLRFIDATLARYGVGLSQGRSPIVITTAQAANGAVNNGNPGNGATPFGILSQASTQSMERAKGSQESFTEKTGVLPRSILRTVDRIKRELDPQAEQQVVEAFRDSKTRTVVSLRFILLLIIVPLLTQQVAKNFIVGPVVDHFRSPNANAAIFLNVEMEDEAREELRRYEDRLRFEVLIGKAPPMTEVQIEAQTQRKAAEIEEQYRQRSSDAVKNVFADMFAVAAFVLILTSSKREIAVMKSFIDELIYGLSDSAKAFIIILFTDTFVGFHSPHGWEIILESISRHFGLPANRDFIFLFIATFPVILDTVFKYWIFRYLNRISPSAVATYRNMNE
jgi:hypothetical protein